MPGIIRRWTQHAAEIDAAQLHMTCVITEPAPGDRGRIMIPNTNGHLVAIATPGCIAYCTHEGHWYTAPGYELEPPQMLLF